MKNQSKYNFTLYFIRGKSVYELNEQICDVYIKFSNSEYIYYISFYRIDFILNQLSVNKYFHNTDTIIVKSIEKQHLYETIEKITNNGNDSFHITDHFTNCGLFEDCLGSAEDINDLIM